MQPTDIPITSAFSLVAAETMRAIGMPVEMQAMDWSTITSRRAKTDPVDQGGWNVFHTWWIGGDMVNPIAAVGLSGGGDKAWFGRPSDATVEALRDKFAFGASIEEKQALGREHKPQPNELDTNANVRTF